MQTVDITQTGDIADILDERMLDVICPVFGQ